mgnify:CR=1 FL=1
MRKTTEQKAAPQQEQLRQNEAKWGKPLLAAGWTMLPNVLIQRLPALGLDAVDFAILTFILSHWWEADRLPFPRVRYIAESLGIDQRTVQRRITGLVKAGLLTRIARYNQTTGGRKSNAYSFEKLIAELTPYADEVVREREQKREEQRREEAARARRKKPLKLVAKK